MRRPPSLDPKRASRCVQDSSVAPGLRRLSLGQAQGFQRLCCSVYSHIDCCRVAGVAQLEFNPHPSLTGVLASSSNNDLLLWDTDSGSPRPPARHPPPPTPFPFVWLLCLASTAGHRGISSRPDRRLQRARSRTRSTSCTTAPLPGSIGRCLTQTCLCAARTTRRSRWWMRGPESPREC